MTEDFRTRINGYVKAMVRGYSPSATGEKIIHDPIWGSVVFRPWEVRLIDSPLFQRLRGISQVGLAESTYPAARHTRFEHSLGTAAVASRMMEQLYTDAKGRKEVRDIIGEGEINLLRLAALLHDVGHCPYSHLSEAIYGAMPQFKEMKQAVIDETGQDISPSPHEVFSYLIIVSDAFTTFFYYYIRYPGIKTRAQAAELLKRAANLVVGAVNTDKKGHRLSYLTKVLNGNFDADKLDYTQRDSYTAGIALTYGVERFLLKLVICKTETEQGTDYCLGITEDALSTVEELIFNRSMLYHYMYRHQKVLAAECQMKDAIYALVRVGKIKHPCDFLFLNNQDLSALSRSRRKPFSLDGAKGKTLETLFEAFSRRTLLKRAFQLAPDGFWEYADPTDPVPVALEGLSRCESDGERERILRDLTGEQREEDRIPDGILAYIEFLRGCTPEESVAERRIIADRIAAAYKKAGLAVDFDAFDLALSFQPALKSPLQLTVTDKSRHLIDATPAIGRIRNWTEAFNRGKWRGYLFVAPHINRALAGEVFEEYLKERCRGEQLPLCPTEGRDNVLF